MRYTPLIVIFCLLCCCIKAQTNVDYSYYHDGILVAEGYTSKEDFDISIASYAETFKKYPRAFAKDAYNACQIAALKKHAYFADFFYKCAESGIEKDRLLKNAHISSAYKSHPAKLDTLYAKGYKKYSGRIDTSLRKEFIRRYELEQKHKGDERYPQICSDNFKRILGLAKEGRFPGEDLIGTSTYIESCVFPTLLHYPYSYIALEPYFPDAIKNGKVSPLSVVYLYGFNQTRNSVLYKSIPQDTIHFKTIYNLPFGKRSGDLSEVDENRRSKRITPIEVKRNLEIVATKYKLDYITGYY